MYCRNIESKKAKKNKYMTVQKNGRVNTHYSI